MKIGAVPLPCAVEAFLPTLMTCLSESPIGLALHELDLAEAGFNAETMGTYIDVVLGQSLGQPVAADSRFVNRGLLAAEPLDLADPVDHFLAQLCGISPPEIVGTAWIGAPRDSLLI